MGSGDESPRENETNLRRFIASVNRANPQRQTPRVRRRAKRTAPNAPLTALADHLAAEPHMSWQLLEQSSVSRTMIDKCGDERGNVANVAAVVSVGPHSWY